MLVEQRHVARRLEDVDVVVVRPRPHRRSRVRAHQAAVAQGAVGVVVGEAVAHVESVDCARLAVRVGVGDPAIGRIDDQRRPLVARELDAPLVPELVVGEHPALGARLITGARGARDGIEQVAVQAHPLRCLERGGLLGRQRLPVRQRGGPLQRRQRAEREDAGDVRLPVRGPHRHAGGVRLGDGGDRRGQDDRQQGGERDDAAMTGHLDTPSSKSAVIRPDPTAKSVLQRFESQQGQDARPVSASEPEQAVELDDERPVRGPQVGAVQPGVALLVEHDEQLAARLVLPAEADVGRHGVAAGVVLQ